VYNFVLYVKVIYNIFSFFSARVFLRESYVHKVIWVTFFKEKLCA
jgi:hypothetical protein